MPGEGAVEKLVCADCPGGTGGGTEVALGDISLCTAASPPRPIVNQDGVLACPEAAETAVEAEAAPTVDADASALAGEETADAEVKGEL